MKKGLKRAAVAAAPPETRLGCDCGGCLDGCLRAAYVNGLRVAAQAVDSYTPHLRFLADLIRGIAEDVPKAPNDE